MPGAVPSPGTVQCKGQRVPALRMLNLPTWHGAWSMLWIRGQGRTHFKVIYSRESKELQTSDHRWWVRGPSETLTQASKQVGFEPPSEGLEHQPRGSLGSCLGQGRGRGRGLGREQEGERPWALQTGGAGL